MLVAGARLAVLAYGDQFAGLGATLSALAIVVLMNGASTVVGNGLWAIDQPHFNFIADITTLSGTIVATLLLVPHWNVLGAALAMLIGTSLGCAVRSFQLWRALAALPLNCNGGRAREIGEIATDVGRLP
jgi:O-antigen/teichoic acid export membrane protein